jgi:Protein of unknown function DUF111
MPDTKGGLKNLSSKGRRNTLSVLSDHDATISVTTELPRGVPVYAKDIEGELVTPTGAAILAMLAEGYGPIPLMRIEHTGYGARWPRDERRAGV